MVVLGGAGVCPSTPRGVSFGRPGAQETRKLVVAQTAGKIQLEEPSYSAEVADADRQAACAWL